MKVSYAQKNQSTKAQEIKKAIKNYVSDEEKASYFYSFFVKKTTSKAEFAQQLAFDLEVSFQDSTAELETMLPKYLVDAIKYVTKG